MATALRTGCCRACCSCRTALGFQRDDVPKRSSEPCDLVTDSFRIIYPRNLGSWGKEDIFNCESLFEPSANPSTLSFAAIHTDRANLSSPPKLRRHLRATGNS